MRRRAAARADDRGADRGREDAPGARDGARRADEHAARRRCRRSPATTCYGTFRPAELTGGDTFDLALVGDGTARRARRRHRPRHRAGAVGDADARDAAHGVPPRRRPRDGVHCRSTTSSPRRSPTTASSPLSSALLDPRRPRLRFHQRRPGADPAFPRRDAAPARATSRRAFRSARCRCPAPRPAVSLDPGAGRHPACCCPTASTSTANARGEPFGEARVERIVCERTTRTAWPSCRRAARRGAGLRGGRAAGGRHDARAA